jgi:hypothetical protein
MPDPLLCDICRRTIPPQGDYIVRIEVFANPQMPPITQEELAEFDFDKTLSELLSQMEGMTAEELMDDVHRKFEFHICRPCQMRFLVNPLGKPRGRRDDVGN